MYQLALILSALTLAACASRGPVVPKVVKVPVTVVVEVPEELTRDCDPVPKKKDTFGEAIRLANARLASIEECTARMRQIRNLKR